MHLRSAKLGRLVLVGVLAIGTGMVMAQDFRQTIASRMKAWRQHDIARPKPPVVEPSATLGFSPAPKDAVVLFDGKNLDAWQGADGSPASWTIADGAFVVTPGRGAIQTKAKFGDIQFHAEWASPKPVVGKGQDRGNSGIFFMGTFELQVLDSYQAETYSDGQAGAIYGQYPPLANATRPPGEWQSYDVAFRRPRFDSAGKLIEPARMTVFLNGILVQNNEELFGQTTWLRWVAYENQGDRGVIELQDHGHPVKYRNLWLRELPERPTPTAKDLDRPKTITLNEAALDRFAGNYSADPSKQADPIVIARRGNHLTVRFPFRKTELEMNPIAETVFDMPKTDGRFSFKVDGEGKVTGVLFKIGDGERTLTRLNP